MLDCLWRDLLAYFLLLLSVSGIGVGARFASGGDPTGWIGIGGGLPLAVVSYVLMQPPKE